MGFSGLVSFACCHPRAAVSDPFLASFNGGRIGTGSHDRPYGASGAPSREWKKLVKGGAQNGSGRRWSDDVTEPGHRPSRRAVALSGVLFRFCLALA
jgi:hypothetical protein